MQFYLRQISELEAENNALKFVLQTCGTMGLVVESGSSWKDLVMERGRTEVETDRTNDLAVESDPVVAKGESRKGTNTRRKPPRKRHRQRRKSVSVYTELFGLTMTD